MPARKRDFIIEKGANFQRVLYLKPGPDADVRDFTARMQFRPSPNSDTIALELTTENERIVMGYGTITLNVSATVTASIDSSQLTMKGKVTEPAPAGELPYEAEGKLAVYDLEIISPSGIVTRYLSGQGCFVDNTTR